ncbi:MULTISPECIES: folate-binding protein YgfZ [Polynucleobacter]|uniref:CAF17-like 4Fe-4S cluster assembly/insertion protein YgfZ n=1 Tax=Polynucleobacter TaxID=44013 RepID=UPI0009EF2163|nr:MULTISPECIES: folate-binding protein YgfZ [Polynucleobacter]MBU3551837.1 folate-binding protein YgfZ [Polynucleobacter sp. MWH-Post4-6-1]
MTNISQNTQIQDQIPSSGRCLLPQWGLILVEGPDAASFLQNQLTNSVLGLRRTISPQIAETYAATRLVGYCSPKGRLLASAWITLAPVSESSDDRFALFISKDIAASIAKRIAMFVLRSKVKVRDVSDQMTISGYFSANSDITKFEINNSAIGLRLPDVLVNSQSFGRILVAQENVMPTEDHSLINTWNDLEVLSAIPRIVLATQEQFVPQMINFESVAGVDFKKGCYPGQEIVARSQYRGVIKRRLFLAHTDSAADQGAFGPGTELFHSLDPSQPAGMVVLSAPCTQELNRLDLQVECKLEALEQGEIRLGSAQGPVLKIDTLPYPLIEI